jgi:hypothetical protein
MYIVQYNVHCAVLGTEHKGVIHVEYIEYQSAFSSSELGPPTPFPADECVPILGPKGESKTLLQVMGDPIQTTGLGIM